MLCTRCLRRGLPLLRSYASQAQVKSYSTEAKPIGRGDESSGARSGTLAGTPLKNINYYKSRGDPIALEDHEYPKWLWKCLDSARLSADGDKEDEGDLYSKSKKARRIAAKRAAKVAAIDALDTEIRVPIDEQTLDLPFATTSSSTSSRSQIRKVVSAVGPVASSVKTHAPAGRKGVSAKKPTTVEIGGDVHVTYEEAQKARQTVKHERRRKGRAGIKEHNYLSSM
ncbi:hypothetical protein RUND412_001967 [Rhizina undulata]